MLKRLEKKVEGMRSQVKDRRRAERERADAEVLQKGAGDGKVKDQRRTEHERVNAEVWRKSEGDGKV